MELEAGSFALNEGLPMPSLRRPGLLWKQFSILAQDADLEGDLVGAEKYYRIALRLAKHARGPNHEDVGETLINLADCLAMQGKFAESERMYRKALALYERIFGRDTLIAGMIYRVLAELYITQRRVGEAKLMQQRSLAIFGGRVAS